MEKSTNKILRINRIILGDNDFAKQIKKSKIESLNKIHIKSIMKDKQKSEEKWEKNLNEIIIKLKNLEKKKEKIDFISDSLIVNDLKSIKKNKKKRKFENFNIIIQNMHFYNKLLNKFFTHPCFVFKLILYSEKNVKKNLKNNIFNLFLCEFTSNKKHYRSYMFSLLILFLKHEVAILMNYSKKEKEISIFKKIYLKMLNYNSLKKNNFYQKVKNIFIEKVQSTIKDNWENIFEEKISYYQPSKILNKYIMNIFIEIIDQYFILENTEEIIDNFIISVNKKIYNIIKKFFKKKNKKEILSESTKQKIKFFIVWLFMSDFMKCLKIDNIDKNKNQFNFFFSKPSKDNLKNVTQNSIINFNHYLNNTHIFNQNEINFTKKKLMKKNFDVDLNDSYLRIFDLITQKLNLKKWNNTFENLNCFINANFLEDTTPMFIDYETLIFFEKTCFYCFSHIKKKKNIFKRSSVVLFNTKSLKKIDSKVINQVKNFYEEKKKEIIDYSFIQNKKIKNIIDLLYDKKKIYNFEKNEKIIFNICPNLKEEFKNLENENGNFIFCSLCELILPRSLIFDLDLKIYKIIKTKGWPCFLNKDIHSYNFLGKLKCSKIEEEAKCNKLIKAYYFNFFTIFKNIHYYKYRKDDFLKKIKTLDFLLNNLKKDANTEDFLNLLINVGDSEIKSSFEIKSENKLLEIKSNLKYLQSLLLENKKIDFSNNIKITFYKLRKLYKSIYKFNIYENDLKHFMNELKIKIEKKMLKKEINYLKEINIIFQDYNLDNKKIKNLDLFFLELQNIKIKKIFSLTKLIREKIIFSFIFDNNTYNEELENKIFINISFLDSKFLFEIIYNENFFPQQDLFKMKNFSVKKRYPILDSFFLNMEYFLFLKNNLNDQNIIFMGNYLSFKIENLYFLLAEFVPLIIKLYSAKNKKMEIVHL